MCLKAYSGLIGEAKALATGKVGCLPLLVCCFIEQTRPISDVPLYPHLLKITRHDNDPQLCEQQQH